MFPRRPSCAASAPTHPRNGKDLTMKTTLLLTALLLTPGLAPAQDDPKNINGYGKAVWGMTVPQVLEAESPRASPAAKKDSFGDGAVVLIDIQGIEISGTPFQARFAFKNDKLTRVQVTTSEDKRTPGCVNGITFSSIEQRLTEKYGAPVYRHITRSDRDVSWTLPKTLINLAYMEIDGTRYGLGCTSHLNVTYSPVTVNKDL